MRLPDSRIVPTADLFSKEELKTSLAYNEGSRRYGEQNGLIVRLDGPSGSHIVWGIADPVDASGWSSSRVAMIARILPHLRRYVRVRSALADAGALGASLAELLDNTHAGVIHLDRGGRVVEANDSARELLRRDDGLSDAGGTLHAAWPEDDTRLQALLARALPRLVGRGPERLDAAAATVVAAAVGAARQAGGAPGGGLPHATRGRARVDRRPGEPGRASSRSWWRRCWV